MTFTEEWLERTFPELIAWEPEDADDPDLGECAYYRAYIGWPGADPNAICTFGCWEEPSCVTCEPHGGWPSTREFLKEQFDA